MDSTLTNSNKLPLSGATFRVFFLFRAAISTDKPLVERKSITSDRKSRWWWKVTKKWQLERCALMLSFQIKHSYSKSLWWASNTPCYNYQACLAKASKGVFTDTKWASSLELMNDTLESLLSSADWVMSVHFLHDCFLWTLQRCWMKY